MSPQYYLQSPHMLCLVTQSCLTLCNPMDCTPPGSSVHGGSPGKNIGVGCHAILQEVFPIQGLNPVLSHWRGILYHLSHQRSPRVLEWVTYPLSRGSSNPGIACIAGGFFTNWAIREALWKSKLRLKTWSAVKDSDITILTVVAFNMKNMWWSTHIVSEC